METNCLATQMSKCCLHGDLTSVVRMHSLNTTNPSTISGNVGYLSDRYHLTTVLLASPGKAQIRDRWKRTTTKQKRKDVGRKLLGWKTQWWPHWRDMWPFQNKGSDTSEGESYHTGSSVCFQPDTTGLIQQCFSTNSSSSSLACGRVTGPNRLWLRIRTISVIVVCP